MKVVATQRGEYPTGTLREAGEVFEFDMEKDAKRPWARDEDGKIVRDEATDTPVQDEDGEPILPSWMEEASEENVREYAKLPLNHPALDEDGRPFLYTTPGVPPGDSELAPNVESERKSPVDKGLEAADEFSGDEQDEQDEFEQARAEGEGTPFVGADSTKENTPPPGTNPAEGDKAKQGKLIPELARAQGPNKRKDK